MLFFGARLPFLLELSFPPPGRSGVLGGSGARTIPSATSAHRIITTYRYKTPRVLDMRVCAGCWVHEGTWIDTFYNHKHSNFTCHAHSSFGCNAETRQQSVMSA